MENPAALVGRAAGTGGMTWWGLTATVTPDVASGVILVALRGVLTLESAPTARAVLRKCLAGQPHAVLVDISELSTDSRTRLAVFPAAVRAHGPDAPTLLLYCASAQLGALLNGRLLDDIARYDTLEQARAAAADRPAKLSRRVFLRLPPIPGAVAKARDLVTQACRAWQLDHLRGPATQVISELVSNAVQHAGTDMRVDAVLRGGYLHLSVRDRNRQVPRAGRGQRGSAAAPAERGRGLFLIEHYATAWGSTPTLDGKAVWATLRATPVAGS